VELEIAAGHDGEHEAERVLGLEGVGQVDDEPRVDLLEKILRNHFGQSLRKKT
jgi:hypothetical protein